MELDDAVRVLTDRAREEVSNEAVTRALSAPGRACHEEGAVGDEDQSTPRPKEPVRLLEPAVWLAPEACPVFGDGEIEALALVGDLLGIRVDERECEPELLLQ